MIRFRYGGVELLGVENTKEVILMMIMGNVMHGHVKLGAQRRSEQGFEAYPSCIEYHRAYALSSITCHRYDRWEIKSKSSTILIHKCSSFSSPYENRLLYSNTIIKRSRAPSCHLSTRSSNG